MNKMLERMRNDFQGNADALIAKAQEVAKTLNLDQEASEGNERLLRHYVSIAVVDRPSREGRDALYGFRHLLQFVAARRLLAEGFSLAQIAKFTAVVPTDALSAYLEKSGRASEAELLVAAFRVEAPAISAPTTPPRRSATPKSLPSVATGMGMVDVVHEMREMEQRVHAQLKDFQRQVHAMVDDAMRDLGSQSQGQRADPLELKLAVGKLAHLMEEATERFDHMLQKPMIMIEKQMEQQRYLFEEAHKQKDLLERMFGKLFDQQQQELRQFLDYQSRRLNESLEMQKNFYHHVGTRLDAHQQEMNSKLVAIEKHVQTLMAQSHPSQQKKGGTA
jgi:DNA-binding transcriptional MerR regulator